MQTKEGKVDSNKALDASLVVTESSGTESDKQVTNSKFRNDTHVNDVVIKPVNDIEPMAEVQLTTVYDVLANEQQLSEQFKPIYDTNLLKKVDSSTSLDSTNMCHKGGEIDQNTEKYGHMASKQFSSGPEPQLLTPKTLSLGLVPNHPSPTPLQISQSPRDIFLNQSKYALEIIKKYGMETSDPVDTPMVEKSNPDLDPQGKKVDPTCYRRMIGSLMYRTASRLDLAFVV
nr:uncharacterized mitochondrial protein AtMg00810-like [Tanacetum cinerariifolium]